MERYRWLDELENKIEIEEIGVKFRNQIKKLRDLTKSLGISGHQSQKLDDVLSCNLAQSKMAMESISKLDKLPFDKFFPSRKEDAKAFIQLLRLYEDMVDKIEKELTRKEEELNRRTGLNAINLEITTIMNEIDNNLKILIKKDIHAS